LRRYYRPRIISGFVADELGRPLRGARLEGVGKRVMTDKNGYFSFQIPGRSSHEDQNISLRVSALFFEEILVNVRPEGRLLQVTLVKTEKDWHFRLLQKVKDWVEKDLTPQVK
jgi:hypothetical protein